MEQDVLPAYDAANMSSADKRAAYALERIAFRVGRIERKFDELIAVLHAFANKAS